ncbi:ABC transporter substrate-binding protein [Actinomadura sp. 9N407]|uniref:ABC transporter substrate-binding protein n=1 Tax=Actinomadura sp. 9N407 TaxID=3375154 RepID=UPI0037A38F4E
MRPVRPLIIGMLVLAMAGCSARSGDTPGDSTAAVTLKDFGTLKNVCQTGTPKASTSQGVTGTEIKLGVLSDVGFTKNPEFGNAAKVFSAWCNDSGGINGRKLVPEVRDTKLMEVRQRMLEACQKDFALVGGGTALDAMGVKDRLSCLLPEFSAQTSQVQALGSDLQVVSKGASVGHNVYAGFYSWLMKEAFPSSAASVGLIAGDSPVSKVINEQTKETLAAMGGTITYTDLYPARGVADWTPYAQDIKNKKLKGLVFLGDYRQLAKLLQVLTDIDYKLDWVDANNNAYGPAFLKLAGPALTAQATFADLSGIHPLEKAAENPATKQVVDLYAKYAPDAEVTLPTLRAFSAWVLFATSARDCSELTRKCVYENAVKPTEWTAGGLQAPVDLSKTTAPLKCFNAVQATAKGWTVPDFKPNSGTYRCGGPVHKYAGDYGKPLTLAMLGKTMADVK